MRFSFYSSPVGGLLNATFGNATELIISVFALQNGLIRVVRMTLLVSILSSPHPPSLTDCFPDCFPNRLSPTPVGGLLNATFGNATELIISIFALQNGLIRVVQMSLLGSILSNMLLVLGCAFYVGGLRYREQTFNKTAALVNSGLLLMAVMGLTAPAVLQSTHTELHERDSTLALSRFSSVMMLVAYACYLFFQLKTHSHLYDD
ncbi:unnamed protein product, partial [Closterium sp. NIES-53]